MKIFKLKDIERMLTEQNYKFVSLFDQSGKQIIPYNSQGKTTISVHDRMKEIEARLNSEVLPDGYYTIKCKNSIRTEHADCFTLYKGEIAEGNPAPVAPMIIEKPVFQPEVLTYEGALKLQIEVERLKLENAALKKDIEHLQSELSEIESENLLSEEESGKSEMFENAKTFLSEIVSFAAPLLDKHFELKEKALGLRALELRSKTDFSGKAKPAPEQKKPVNVAAWIATFEDQPETYNSLVAIYNEAKSVENFYENLRTYDEQLFTECLEYGKGA